MRLEQADGTAWMAYYSVAMLVLAVVLAERNPVYDDMVVKFLEQFVLIMRRPRGLRACTTPTTGSSTTGSSTPTGESPPIAGARRSSA